MHELQDLKLIVSSETDDFEQSVIIHTIVKKYSVFIQTDRALYKPSDKVQFRIFVLNAETKPYQYKKIQVRINDAVENTVYKREFNYPPEFVIEDEHLITEDPFLGSWKISVQVDNEGQFTEFFFQVDEYVLPRFEAFIRTNQHVTFSELKIRLSIFGKYNFGEYVSGKAKLTIKIYDSKYKDKLQKEHHVVVADILTPQLITIDFKRDLKIISAVRDLVAKVTVEFEEKLTGKIMYTNETITIRKEDSFKINVIRPHMKFKPGFPFFMTVVVRRPNGAIIEKSPSTPVFVMAEFFYSLPKCTLKNDKRVAINVLERNLQGQLEKGKVDFEMDVPKNTSAITITITYLSTKKVVNVMKFPTKSRDYLEAKVVDKR